MRPLLVTLLALALIGAGVTLHRAQGETGPRTPVQCDPDAYTVEVWDDARALTEQQEAAVRAVTLWRLEVTQDWSDLGCREAEQWARDLLGGKRRAEPPQDSPGSH